MTCYDTLWHDVTRDYVAVYASMFDDPMRCDDVEWNKTRYDHNNSDNSRDISVRAVLTTMTAAATTQYVQVWWSGHTKRVSVITQRDILLLFTSAQSCDFE